MVIACGSAFSGHWEVLDDDVRPRALLTLLASRSPVSIGAAALVEALWAGERPADRPRRRPCLLTGAEPDADRFTGLLGVARRAPLEDRVRLLRESLALWRSPALADAPDWRSCG